MKRASLVPFLPIVLAFSMLSALLWFTGETHAAVNAAFLAPSSDPSIIAVDPNAAPNDVDTPIIIQGTGFTATISGTEVITAPLVYLGDVELPEVIWGNTTTLSATLPWGLEPTVYPITVVNPDGVSVTLQNAFTVTEGFNQFATGGPYGGNVIEIYKKPGDPNTVFALAEEVGIFRSEDGGAHWELRYKEDGYQTTLSFDAQNPDVIYYRASYGWAARSLDGGDTWEHPLNLPFGGQCGVGSPVAHPALGGVVYAGVGSCSGIALSQGDGGVFRSDNYGADWITKTIGITDTDVQSIAIHPTDTLTMVAGTKNGRLYQSVDGGETWNLTMQFTGTVEKLTFNPYAPLQAWATIFTDDGYRTLRSTDLANWEFVKVAVDDSRAIGNFSFLPGTIWATNGSVYTSTNGGTTWQNVNNSFHNQAIEVTPDDPDEIFIGTGFDSIHVSNDGGQTWQETIEGLAGLVPNVVTVSPADLDTVYVNTGQGFFRSFSGGYTWQKLDDVGLPDGSNLAADPFTSTRVYWGAGIRKNFQLAVSANAGGSWNWFTATLPAEFAGWDSTTEVVAPHPRVPGRILVGSTVWQTATPDETQVLIYASDDYGQTWNHLATLDTITSVQNIAYDAVDPNLVYLASDGGGLWKSEDGGDTWGVTTHPEGRKRALEVVPYPNLADHVLLDTSDQNNGTGMYASDDAGESWNWISGVSGPLVYVEAFPPILYGHGLNQFFQGILVRSFDNGLTWEEVAGAPRPRVLASATDGERAVLYIGSNGGLVTQASAQSNFATNSILSKSTIFGGGVYRLTSLLPTEFVYLPLIIR